MTPTATPTSTPIACNGGNAYTFVNNEPYPVWLAEQYQAPSTTIVAPPNNNWELAGNGGTFSLCMPAGWSGRFWPRTECHFDTLFSNDPGYQSCTTTSQCGSGHVCYGGKCMLDCTTGGTPFCQGSSGLNNSNATCAPTTSGGGQVCTYSQGLVCATGDCQGLFQCVGTWGSLTALVGGTAPLSLIEPTSNSSTNVNYDVSLVDGYVLPISVQPSVAASGANCYAPSCTSDLNASCPADLQITKPPTSVASSTPCGSGTFCQSGVCVNNDTCVIACITPGDRCGMPKAPTGLMCNSMVDAAGDTYLDMYQAKNASLTNGDSMSSGLQGTAVCWGAAECTAGETCTMGLSNVPSGVGLCTTMVGGVPVPSPTSTNCVTQADVGKACGGYANAMYPSALGYTCVKVGSGTNQVACIQSPAVTGLGTLESPAGLTALYTGEGGLLNPAWVKAATQAGGGTTPYYETFGASCPKQYAWQYDDHAGGVDCKSGGAQVNFTVTFGLK